MENNNKKRIQRVKAAPRKLIIKQIYKCNQKFPVCFFLKIAQKKYKAQADQRLPYRNCVNVN